MITFILTNKARDRSPIALLVSFKGKKYKKSTGVSCLVRMWNQNKKRIKVTTSNPEANEDNDTLDKWEIAAKETLSEFKTCRKAPIRRNLYPRFSTGFTANKTMMTMKKTLKLASSMRSTITC